jgi:prephenate dehydratase
MKVAIQGKRGSFHHEAAERLLLKTGETVELVECDTFRDVFEAVDSGTAVYGVSAVENNIFGSINPVYGLLERYHLWVAGDITLHVNQYLIAHAPTALEDLNHESTEVLSQVMALSQCTEWLTKHLPKASRKETNDTAGSVKWIMEKGDSRYTALAGRAAADIYGGTIIAGPINDDPNNYTRFFLLQKERKEVSGAERTSIILRTGHTFGALYQAIGAFVKERINLSKLDSHPVVGDTRQYAFYLDFDAALSSDAAQRAITELQTQLCTIKILGSYPITE